MSYYEELVKWKDFDYNKYFNLGTVDMILSIINKDKCSIYYYLY